MKLWRLVLTMALLLVACQPQPPPQPQPAPPPTRLPTPPPTAAPKPTPVSVDPRRTLFGIDEGIRNDPLLAESGAKWQRLVIPWTVVQPSGPVNFDGLSRVLPPDTIAAQVRRGVRIAGLLQFTPAWAQSDRQQGERSPPRNLDLPYDHPDNYFGRFAYETARHFGGSIDEWIIWNEPEFKPGEPGVGDSYTWLGTDAQYAQLLKVGYQAIKAANPRAIVSFAGTSYWTDALARRPQFYERVLDILKRDGAAARNNTFHDALSLNLYRSPDDLVRVHAVFKDIQARHGVDVPLWLTETNAMPTDDTRLVCSHGTDPIKTTMDQQAAFAVQAFALAAAVGYRRVGFYQMVDGDPCRQPGVWGATRDDGSRRPVADTLRAAMSTFGTVEEARFTPVERLEQAWPAWPEDSSSLVPNWEIYQVQLQVAERRRVTVIWNGDGEAVCTGVKKNGTSVRMLDKRGALQLEPVERDGWWWLSLPPATARGPADPPGYFFIGGDPLLLVEDGVAADAPTLAPATGCSFDGPALSVERGFVASLTPAGGQTVARGEAAEFQVLTRGLAGFGDPISLRLLEWSTQRFPATKPASALPLRMTMPESVSPGARATIRLETAGVDTGIYYLGLEASSSGLTRRLDIALVVE